MKTTGVLSLLGLLVAVCAAQAPKPCVSPPLLHGGFTTMSDDGLMGSTGTMSYDAFSQRVHMTMMSLTGNGTSPIHRVLLFGKKIMYEINWRTFSCRMKPLNTTFQPMRVPEDAQLLAQVVMGSSSSFGMGVLVNNWFGTLPGNARYTFVFTEVGCIPLTYSIYTPEEGWNMISTFNWVLGTVDPGVFIPPFFCRKAKLEESDAPETMLTALKSLVREAKGMK
ncbi:ependymin-like isoform 2-T2 [Synchiropus picturatus]